MNRINEIGDTPRGQKALGAVFARAHNRKNWCDKNMVEPHRKDAKDYWQNVEHNASSEVDRNAKDKLKGFENFGDGAQEYYKNHLPNDTIQIPQHESKNTNMNKKLIRLTENDLHKIVKESVNRVLREGLAEPLVFWRYIDDYNGQTEEKTIDELQMEYRKLNHPYFGFVELMKRSGWHGPYDELPLETRKLC